MRVLVGCHSRAIVGGVETYLRAVLPGLEAAGLELGLLYEREGEPTTGRVDDGLSLPRRWCVAEAGAQAALAGVAGWRPDVVYLHNLEEPALEAELVARFDAVHFAHDYRGTCVSGTKRHALPAASPCTRALGPGCLVHYLPRRCGGLNPATALALYRVQRARNAIMRRYRAVLVASHAMRAELIGSGLSPEAVQVTPHPSPRAPDAAPPGPRPAGGGLLMVGRLTELKGGAALLRALPAVRARLGRDLSLTIAGDGPERGQLEKRSQRQGLGVEFVGWVDAAARERLMRAAQLLVVPSLWPEPFGLVGIEAGSVGLPAAAYAHGGIVDWCVPGVSGELAPSPPTDAGLAEAIVRALQDPAHHHQLRLGAWRTAQRFSAAAHLEALRLVLGAGIRGPRSGVQRAPPSTPPPRPAPC